MAIDPREALAKAAGDTLAGTDWQNGPGAAGTMRGDFNASFAGSDLVQLTDAERQFLVDTVVDESSLLKEVRRYTMNRSRVEIPRMSLGRTVLQANVPGGQTEGVAGVDQAPDFETIVLTSSKLTLPWTVTEEFLEDNPEKGSAEAKIARLMAIQAANDLEDLAINGDETNVGHALFRANDGYITLADAQCPAGQLLAFAGAGFTTDVLQQMLRAMPTRYRRNVRELRFFVGPNIWQDYVQSIAARQGAMADQYLAGLVGDPTYGGIPLRMSPFMPEDAGVGLNEAQIILTHPDNLIWGVERDMKLRKTTEGKEAIKEDKRFYALHIRCDFQIQNPGAVVKADGVAPRVA
jgi:HK97 family phage major capsid protein